MPDRRFFWAFDSISRRPSPKANLLTWILRIAALLLLLSVLLSCTDNPAQPALTEDEIEALIDKRLAEMQAANEDVRTPQEINRIVAESVVYLHTSSGNGSGFFVDTNQVATCYHVIKDMKNGVISSVYDQKEYPITAVLAVDAEHDLAIVQVRGYKAPVLPLAIERVQIGQSIYVLSNPQGWKGTFSSGIVSGLRAGPNILKKGELIQISAPISPGSSGGPVVDGSANVIGVCAAGFLWGAQNLNFAIPVNHLKTLLATIR